MVKKNITIKCYEFCTPKFGGDRQFEYVYDYELMDTLFNAILALKKSERKYKDDTVSFNLGDFRQSSDANRVEGYFITARHGVRRTQIDIDSQQEVGTIEKYHGVENNVYFMIDRISGLLLVQDDFNRVFNRKLLHTFLIYHRSLIYPYIDKFNEINEKNTRKIHKRSCFRLTTLPPIDFMDKLQEFKEVKSAVLTLDHSTEKSLVDVSQMLDAELDNNGIEDYDLEIKIKNKTGRSMVKVFEQYFEKIIELQKYDSYAIEGILENGKTKKITPDTITRDFYTRVEFNGNGEPSMEELFTEMNRIITHKNPIAGKKGTPNIIAVGEDKDVEGDIQKEISKRNEDPSGRKETS